ncbi:ATP-binding protein, partial [Roseovarius sp. SYSU LYC5161]|uniref:ATP-binding protein n=1 Tax=Roseovarius halophilus (ex Wu et al. 2025) TaxID=3376060 RepID=UPI00399BED2F
AAVARRVVGVLKRTPDGARLDWTLDIAGGLVLAIDEADLAEALGALTENAARHAVAGVTLTGTLEDGFASLCITDDGPGLPPERLAEMTARGMRADDTRPGSGLGLTIAADVARAAGGDLTLRNGPGGLVACLRLPGGRDAGP